MDLSNKNVVHIKNDNMEYIQFRKLLEYKDILTHAFSIGKKVDFRTASRNIQGKINIVNYNKAMKDYEKLCLSLELDKNNIVKPIQTHGDKIEIVNGKIQKDKPDIYVSNYLDTDGLITQKKSMVLATTSADCILMFFFDPETKTIANVHSGWRGTYKKIGVKTVEKMQYEFNVKPENLICCMCPSIRKCHFEVKKDVKDLFVQRFNKLEEFAGIIEKCKDSNEEKWKIDTIELNRILLKQKGLKQENIIDSKICTVCNCEKMHSYRIEKEEYGLETAIISLK